MDKKEFVLNTLLPYIKNPEICAYNDGTCHYIMEDGRRCAVGRHIQDKKVKKLHGYTGTADELFLEYGLEILTKEAKEANLSVVEWKTIQEIHDNIGNNLPYISLVNNLERITGLQFSELKNSLTINQ